MLINNRGAKYIAGIFLGKISEIKTGIDKFLDLINASGETKVDIAASKLGVPAETIEIWAEILQQDNAIEIGYDGFGKMTVRPITSQKPALQKNKPAANAKEDGPKQSLLKKIKEKSPWKMRLENKTRNSYASRLKTPDVIEAGKRAESVFSRILKRLGIKK